jgi:hypothetical protein
MPMQPFSSIVATPATPGAEDTALLRASVTDDWLQGRAAFGGLQGALGALAMRAAVGDGPPLRALQMTFVAAIEAGEACHAHGYRVVEHDAFERIGQLAFAAGEPPLTPVAETPFERW